jgi:hypothetical protein
MIVGGRRRARAAFAVVLTAGAFAALPGTAQAGVRTGRFVKGSGTMSCAMDGSTSSFGLDMDTVLPDEDAALPVNGTSTATALNYQNSRRFSCWSADTVRAR